MTRFMGTETEYGITTPDDQALSPIVSSTHAVVAYAAMNTAARARWDYQAEHPLKDSRGFDLKRYHTVPVVAPNAIGVANVVTSNGARFYVDHAHPEYSSPEVADAYSAMVYDAAGDLILRQAAERVAQLYNEGVSVLEGHDPCPPLKFYKNNVDGKGASYGSHENYQYSRDTPFEAIAAGLIPFFVTRQIFAGAGRVGIGEEGEQDGFQISQRADYFFQEVSLETTLNRGRSSIPATSRTAIPAGSAACTSLWAIRIWRRHASDTPSKRRFCSTSVSTTTPALWRVDAYCGPGLPRPTIKTGESLTPASVDTDA